MKQQRRNHAKQAVSQYEKMLLDPNLSDATKTRLHELLAGSQRVLEKAELDDAELRAGQCTRSEEENRALARNQCMAEVEAQERAMEKQEAEVHEYNGVFAEILEPGSPEEGVEVPELGLTEEVQGLTSSQKTVEVLTERLRSG
jgi:hypothetical protein